MTKVFYLFTQYVHLILLKIFSIFLFSSLSLVISKLGPLARTALPMSSLQPYTVNLTQNHRLRYQRVVEDDKLGSLLRFLKEMIRLCLPAHLRTTKISGCFNDTIIVLEELGLHIASRDVMSFLKVFTWFVEGPLNVRRTVYKPKHVASFVKEYRQMVHELWKMVLQKVAMILRLMKIANETNQQASNIIAKVRHVTYLFCEVISDCHADSSCF